MNSDYVTALQIEQHRTDLVRLAEQARSVRAARVRRRRSDRPAPALTSRLWRHRESPGCQPEVAGA